MHMNNNIYVFKICLLKRALIMHPLSMSTFKSRICAF